VGGEGGGQGASNCGKRDGKEEKVRAYPTESCLVREEGVDRFEGVSWLRDVDSDDGGRERDEKV
jgi:hypothetical protein